MVPNYKSFPKFTAGNLVQLHEGSAANRAGHGGWAAELLRTTAEAQVGRRAPVPIANIKHLRMTTLRLVCISHLWGEEESILQ